MDDMGSRRQKSEARGRRRKLTKRNGRNILKFLATYKNTLFSCCLLLLMVVLLFGIFSQLQAPTTSTVPVGATVVDYSAFIQQVKAGKVEAATVQGNAISGLLSTTSGSTSTSSSDATKPDDSYLSYAAWTRNESTFSPSFTNPGSATTLTSNRIIYTQLPMSGDPQLMPLLLSSHVIVRTMPMAQTSSWLGTLWKFLPIVFLVIVLLLFLSSRSGGRSSKPIDDRVTQIGKSRARRFVRAKEANIADTTNTANTTGSTQPDAKATSMTKTPASSVTSAKPVTAHVSLEPPVTFADVAGIEEVRTELEEIVQFLRSPERFNRLGARIPRGALLVGPPGTGKTLLARAVAGEAGVPFFSISASEFVEMFVGVGASRVRDLFNQARQVAPCVIFIDEIDAVGRKRSMRVTGNDERDQTLNQLLVELDGFNERQAVVVLAATNRADILDKALLRPGRFDRRITVSLPDRTGREAILSVHTRRTPLHENVSLERLSRMTTGMSGADLANLVNEAALSAARRNMDYVTHECFEDALARVQLGALRPLVMSERERRIIAYHEGGHALVARYLPEADTVNRVTILPRGQSLGVTQFTAEEDRYNYSREVLMTRIAVALGGRVAEELTFGSDHVTTGAENDLQVVTGIARRMVTRWGMSERVGVVFADYQPESGDMGLNMRRIKPDDVPTYGRTLVADEHGQLRLNGNDSLAHQYAFAMSMSSQRTTTSTEMNAIIDAEVQRILNEGREMARSLLTEHAEQLIVLADALMMHEQLDRTQFEALFV